MIRTRVQRQMSKQAELAACVLCNWSHKCAAVLLSWKDVPFFSRV